MLISRYVFKPYFDGYFQEGKFHTKDGRQLTEKVYNGCRCIQVGKKRYGINKLRKLATRIEVEQLTTPF